MPSMIIEAFRLKVETVGLRDGKLTEMTIHPADVVCSGKAYLGGEYHVTVHFDLTQFQKTATEKLLHAQLLILTAQLVDEQNRKFETEDKLAKRGLPIYVFEETDQEELIKEESNDVRDAIENTIEGKEIDRIDQDVSIEKDNDIKGLDKVVKTLYEGLNHLNK